MVQRVHVQVHCASLEEIEQESLSRGRKKNQ